MPGIKMNIETPQEKAERIYNRRRRINNIVVGGAVMNLAMAGFGIYLTKTTPTIPEIEFIEGQERIVQISKAYKQQACEETARYEITDICNLITEKIEQTTNELPELYASPAGQELQHRRDTEDKTTYMLFGGLGLWLAAIFTREAKDIAKATYETLKQQEQ